jgi:hypothetical protein
MKIADKSCLDRNYSGQYTQKAAPICEAVGCYEAATEAIFVPAGKFGKLTFNLCLECAVTKFGYRTCKV